MLVIRLLKLYEQATIRRGAYILHFRENRNECNFMYGFY